MRRSSWFLLWALLPWIAPAPVRAGGLSDDGRAGVVTAVEGTALVRPVGHERWTPLDARGLVFPGDVVRTEARGANALEIRLTKGTRLAVGPGASFELPDDGGLRLLRGDVEVRAEAKAPLSVAGPGGFRKDLVATAWLRATDRATTELPAEPAWLKGYRSSTSEEWMGALLANVNGRNVPLTVGYHKVVVEVRDQIARTTVEESFVNSTDSRLEGVFSFPLPADASISGFGMWIGDELVEADVVEKERAREIYEDILRRKKDPGLLEWEGGNLFKARVFPIEPRSEKRIRIRYTQVLPLEGDAFRYRYALRSELLTKNPLRELAIQVSVASTKPILDVSSPTHEVTVRRTDHEAMVEFGAQEYAPDRDFEVAVRTGRGQGVTAVAHRRGDDGFFMVLLAPPSEDGGGWRREAVPEGEPLDLVVIADTSGSMDAASRDAQGAFVSALLGQLGPKDRFRLMTADVAARWASPEPLSGEEGTRQALAFLDARASLGWTDLDAAFRAALAVAGPRTHVVYVGDGIPTAGDADPVAFAGRLKGETAATKATFHAVSVSSSYEKSVLDAVASIGGGSVRAADKPAQAAFALLAEVARPGVKDLRVEVRGVPTARVYPETLPNVAVGSEQAVIGRFLPGGGAGKTAEVVVTGTLAGQPVRYASTFAVPAAEEGNSFLPRLWARKHLDVLLAGGSNAETKRQVVELSREYQIMTPYTSFLVLESDEDREKYGVERTVHMRDAEQFFAEARDRAVLEGARKQMEVAKGWRLGLRRRMLREIAGLGRDLPVQVAVAWGDGNGDGRWGERISFADGATYGPLLGRGGGFGGAPGGKAEGLREPSDGSYLAETRSALGDRGIDFEGLDTFNEMTAAPEMAPASSPAPTPAMAAAAEPTSPAEADEIGEGPEADPGLEDREQEYAKSPAPGRIMAHAKEARRRNLSRDDAPYGYVGQAAAAPAWLPSRLPAFPPLTLGGLGVPDLGPPLREEPAEPPDPAWDPVVLQALRAIDRRADLRAIEGALRLEREQRSLHPTRGRTLSRWATSLVVSPRRWHQTSDGTGMEPGESWVDAENAGVLAAARRLGRRRPAADWDRTHPPMPLDDLSLGGVIRWLQGFGTTPTFSREGDVLRVVFAHRGDPGRETRFSIDVTRRVLLEQTTWFDGRLESAVRWSDFVQVAGRWWATKTTTTDEEGRTVRVATLKVEALDAAAFDAEMARRLAGQDDVLFLGSVDPTLEDAKQAVHDGRAELAHRLVVFLRHATRQEWAEAKAALDAADPLAPGKPGMAWIRLELLVRSRTGDAAKEALLARARAVAAKDAPGSAWLASWTLSRAENVLGPREALALLDALDPATRRGPDAAWWTQQAALRRAATLERAGLAKDARDLRASLSAAHPDDVDLLFLHLSDRTRLQDVGGVAETLAKRLRAEEPWTREERDRLFSSWIEALFSLRRIADLAAAAEAWVATSPRQPMPYQVRLATLYFLGRTPEADAWVVERLRAELPAPRDAAAGAALQAAVETALGNGWNLWMQRLLPEFAEPLGALALRVARTDGPQAHLTGRVLQDWRFRQTDAWKTLERGLRADLAAEGAVASMPLARLGRYVTWLAWGPETDETAWRRTTDAVLARWRAAAEPADRETLVGLTVVLLDARTKTDEAIAVAREAWSAAPADGKPAAAQRLLDRLLQAPWDAAREDEAFSLLPAVREPKAPLAVQRAQAARTARSLAAKTSDERYRIAFGTPEDRAKLTRAEVSQRARDARRAARGETAARLATARDAGDSVTRPWLEVERLGYAAEHGADLAKTEAEARELLDSVPAPQGDVLAIQSPLDDAYLDGILAERAALVLAYAATRRGAPEGLADRVVALFRAKESGPDRLLEWRYELFRLLVGLDRDVELETLLAAWIDPARVDARWSVALAYLHAERNRLREAATLFEAAAAKDELAGSDYAALADWWLVLKEDARREKALDARWAKSPEWQLQQALWQESSALQRRGEGVPPELNVETLRMLRVLLRKAEHPHYYVGNAVQLYMPTKDHRLLESLADGVLGHTQEAVYEFLQQVGGIVDQVHEEATLDALVKRFEALSAESPGDQDRRALGLLVSRVQARAGMVPKADPTHGRRAAATLRAAQRGAWQAGERARMARYLASLGAPTAPDLAAEQLAQLEALSRVEGEPLADRLAIALAHGQTLWAHGRREEAADRVVVALDAARAENGGVPGPDADPVLDALQGWWTELARWRPLEDMLRRDLAAEPSSGRKVALRHRIFNLYVNALARGGALSFGAGETLFRNAEREISDFLFRGPPAWGNQTLDVHGRLHRAAVESRATPSAAAAYDGFVRERLPEVLGRNPVDAVDALGVVAGHQDGLNGPAAALAIDVAWIEHEPAWYARTGRDAWSRHSWEMAQRRKRAGSVGALAPRLLAIVLAHLEDELRSLSNNGSGFWWRGYDTFWAEKAADFEATASKVAELNPDSPAIQLHVARYLIHGLSRRDAAIALLQSALQRGRIDETGRHELAQWLVQAGRHAEAVPILAALVKERPDTLDYRRLLAVALAGARRADEALAALRDAEKRWKETKAWNESVAGVLGTTAFATGHWRPAADWIDEALRLRRERTAARGPDGQLSAWYGILAQARGKLGETDAAVRAAAAAVVAWGRDQDNRATALHALQMVLAGAKDLDAFVARYEAEVAQSGLDAPTIRKALGRVFLDRNEPKKAALHLAAARTLDPGDGEVHALLVKAHDAAGDPAAAIAALLDSLRLAPRNLPAYADLANRFEKAGDAEGAERARTGLAEAIPNDPDGHRELARLREGAGRWPDAVVQWRHVARTRPLEPEGWLALARAQRQAGDEAGARVTVQHLRSTAWAERFGDVRSQTDQVANGLR